MRRAWNKDTEDFRQANQLKNTRREWDLNRPDAKLMDIPARVGDSDPRCGPSGTQKFDGEDLSVSRSGVRAVGAPLDPLPPLTCRALALQSAHTSRVCTASADYNMCPSLPADRGSHSGTARAVQGLVGGAGCPEGRHASR